jgi:hypothetical protein
VRLSQPVAAGFSGRPFVEEGWRCFSPFALFHLRELSALFASAAYVFTGDVRHFGPYFGKKIAGILVLLSADCLAKSTSQEVSIIR